MDLVEGDEVLYLESPRVDDDILAAAVELQNEVDQGGAVSVNASIL